MSIASVRIRLLSWGPGCALLLTALLLPASLGPPGPAPVELTGGTMGTRYTVTWVQSPAIADRARLGREIQSRLDDLEQKMSTYRPDSELMQLNRADAQQWIPVSTDLYRVLEEGLHWSRETEGAFDISVGALVDLWGFGPTPSRFALPPDREIERARLAVGHQLVRLRASPPSIWKQRTAVALDLSAIAKGYAVDQVADLLRASGLRDFLVEIGGELQGSGRNHLGTPWRVAIEDPLRRPWRHRVELSGVAVASSGDYRNFLTRGGRRYPHIIDPRTGRPVTHGLAAVTVVHPSATTADAMATALISLGLTPGLEFARRHQIAAWFLQRGPDGFEERMTPEFRSYLRCEESCPHD